MADLFTTKANEFYIELKQDRYYFPGEDILGDVILDLKKATKTNNIKITLEGIADIGGKMMSLFTKSVCVAEGVDGQKSYYLEPFTHRFPFKITIPDSKTHKIPSALEITNLIKVEYRLTAVYNKAFTVLEKFRPTTTTTINILERINVEKSEWVNEKKLEKELFLTGEKTKPVKVTAIIGKSAAVKGDVIPISVKIEHFGVMVRDKAISIQLFRSVTHGKNKMEPFGLKLLHEITSDIVISGPTTFTKTFNMKMPIPSHACPTVNESGQYFKIEYSLSVKVNLNEENPHRQESEQDIIVFKIPFVVGTYPKLSFSIDDDDDYDDFGFVQTGGMVKNLSLEDDVTGKSSENDSTSQLQNISYKYSLHRPNAFDPDAPPPSQGLFYNYSIHRPNAVDSEDTTTTIDNIPSNLDSTESSKETSIENTEPTELSLGSDTKSSETLAESKSNSDLSSEHDSVKSDSPMPNEANDESSSAHGSVSTPSLITENGTQASSAQETGSSPSTQSITSLENQDLAGNGGIALESDSQEVTLDIGGNESITKDNGVNQVDLNKQSHPAFIPIMPTTSFMYPPMVPSQSSSTVTTASSIYPPIISSQSSSTVTAAVSVYPPMVPSQSSSTVTSVYPPMVPSQSSSTVTTAPAGFPPMAPSQSSSTVASTPSTLPSMNTSQSTTTVGKNEKINNSVFPPMVASQSTSSANHKQPMYMMPTPTTSLPSDYKPSSTAAFAYQQPGYNGPYAPYHTPGPRPTLQNQYATPPYNVNYSNFPGYQGYPSTDYNNGNYYNHTGYPLSASGVPYSRPAGQYPPKNNNGFINMPPQFGYQQQNQSYPYCPQK